MLQSAQLRAEEVLADRIVIGLSPEASGLFANALNEPARVNERLANALQRPAGFTWID